MTGGAIVPRPHRVPIDSAHRRVTDGVRKGAGLAPRFQQLADAHEASATNAQLYTYDAASGLFVPTDPPDIPWGQSASPPSVGLSQAVTPKNTINVVGLSMTIPNGVSLPATGPTTVKLWKNGPAGSLIATLTVAAGAKYGSVPVTPSAAATIAGRTDYYQIEVTAIGGGADGIGGGIELG